LRLLGTCTVAGDLAYLTYEDRPDELELRPTA
jgi:hypothetical protein